MWTHLFLRCRRVLSCAALLAVAAFAVPDAGAAESTYTDLALGKCRHTPGQDVEDYGIWSCGGHAGIAVWVGAGDQRAQMSFGRNAARQPAAKQTFPGFNSVDNTRIEWRAERPRAAPFAAIVRWNVKRPSDERDTTGRVLVVTRLGEPVCHVGYVDAQANPNANALARELADSRVRTFDCKKDKPVIVGTVGESLAGMAETLRKR